MTKRKTASSRNLPTAAEWKRLYRAAEELKKLAPWRVLYDMDIITIVLPGHEEPFYCSVLGRGGETYGVCVYPGKDALIRFYRMASGSSPYAVNMFEQKCLMCNYGDREEVAREDRMVMQELGLRFRGHNNWIYFRAMEPGYYPWFLNAKQVGVLAEVLENLIMACSYLLRGDIQVDFEAGETLLRFYSDNDDQWLNTKAAMPAIPSEQRYVEMADELLVARLKRQKKKVAPVEIDAFYIPTPVQERKDEIPRLPYVCMLVDRTSGLVLNQNMGERDEDPVDTILSVLIPFIEKYGKPDTIYMRDERMGAVIGTLCKDIGVRTVMGKEMRAMDTVIEELSNLMGNA